MRVCLVTGSRADWGLLQPLAKLMHKDKGIDLQLIVTGSHLSHEFGYTKNDIDLPISEEIECVLSSDTAVGISKAFGLAVISFGEAYKRLNPDAVLVLGDRWEILACAVAAHIAKIPIIHVHGGEVTEGAYDDAFRHSITKMSQLHFAAADDYRNRIIQIGENPDSVFNVGSLGCDGLSKRRGHTENFALFVCHPETLVPEPLVDDLLDITNILHYICILPNNDVGQYEIYKRYYRTWFAPTQDVELRPHIERSEFIDLLGRCKLILGNSSCGIIEAPALGVPTINIGDRQKGRLMADSIIQAEPTKESIRKAFDRLYSKEFQDLMKSDYRIYYKGGNVAEKILEIIKQKMPLEIKKGFYDLAIPQN